MLFKVFLQVFSREGGLSVATAGQGRVVFDFPAGVVGFVEVCFFGVADDADEAVVL